MFGFPGMPDLTDFIRQVEDFKSKFERLVSALEEVQSDVKYIKEQLGLRNPNVPEVKPLTIVKINEVPNIGDFIKKPEDK